MKAVVFDRYGDSSVLRMTDKPVPQPAAHEVLIRVNAAALNPSDLKARAGIYRPFVGWLKPRIDVLGFDIAGTIAGVGSAVRGWSEGDEVMTVLPIKRGGGNAEFATIDADRVIARPGYLSVIEAAAMPLSMVTVLEGLEQALRIQSGQTLLINGACGGVGTLALAVAKTKGARVTAVVHRDNLDLARELGADDVVAFNDQHFAALDRQWDAVFDVWGKTGFFASERAISPGGAYATLLPSPGLPVARLWAPRRNKRCQLVAVFVQPQHMQRVAEYLQQHDVHPVIDRVFPLEQLAEAHDYYQTHVVRGRVIIAVT